MNKYIPIKNHKFIYVRIDFLSLSLILISMQTVFNFGVLGIYIPLLIFARRNKILLTKNDLKIIENSDG